MKSSSDVVIVGGGIAGSAMALVLARHGMDVTVLERQVEYRDRVRGEYLAVWGVAEARRLEILDVLLNAGGVFARRSVRYDETVSPEAAESTAMDLGQFIPGVPGPFCAGHPNACRALSQAAESAGARYRRGIGKVGVVAGALPEVSYENDGDGGRVMCRLVIGADGRTSGVRAQTGISLRRAEPTHLISGLLVDGVSDWPQDTYSIGTQGDVMYYVFPQGGERLRLYTGTAMDQRNRYVGPEGVARFQDDFRRLSCVPLHEELANGTPIGPCASLGGEDTWTDPPFVEGVALIGDAAGYSDPIIGQGLALALRDVQVLSKILLAEPEWSPDALAPYADERRERLRRLRFTAALSASLHTEFSPEGAARRKRFYARLASGDDPSLRMALGAVFVGPDRLPESAFGEEMRRKVLN